MIKNRLRITFILLGCLFQLNAQTETIIESIDIEDSVEEKVINFMAVGDMMLGTTFPNSSYLPSKSIYPFEDAQEIFNQADILFGNLEGTLTDTGKNAKHCKDPSKCYVLSKKTTTFEKDGVTYGFVAFAPNNDCLKLNEITKGIQIVKKMNSEVDVVIVSFHGGAEGTKHKNITRKTEYFYGENRGNVYSFAHKMIDAGADIILGHGPHVPRAIEVYKNKFIAYSMGNFATYKRFSMSGSKAYSPIFELKLKKNGDFINGKIHSAIQTKTRYPFVDTTQKAYQEIKRLTLMDFPENKIKFKEDGFIELK